MTRVRNDVEKSQDSG